MEQVRFGIIGCGVIAPIHAQAIQETPQAKLVAASDVVERNARLLAERWPVDVYTDYRDMIARDDIDAVSLCVPSGLRAAIAEDCARAGKHILAEKPLEVTTERIDRMVRAADAAGVLLGCVFQSRFSDGARHVRKALDEGRFGTPVLGDAYIKWYRSQEYYESGAWRGTRKLDGGGALMNQGVHQVDLLLWFMGPVRTVLARTGLVAHHGLEVEDLACALLTFESGAMGVIEASTAVYPGHAARVEVHGSAGSAVIEDGELRFWQFRADEPEDDAIRAGLDRAAALGSGAGDPTAALTHEGHRRQIEDFAQAVLDGRKPAVDGREARHAIALIEAVYKSAATGEAIHMQG